MLTDTNQKFSIFVPAPPPDKLACIKAVRILTGLGLKDAKDAVERYGFHQTLPLSVNTFGSGLSIHDVIDDQIRILRKQGIEVGAPVYKLLEDLRQLGSQALLQGEDELANEILQLVLAEKLRRANPFGGANS